MKFSCIYKTQGWEVCSHSSQITRRDHGLVGVTPRGLVIRELDECVQFFFGKGLAPSTPKTYEAAAKRFREFCQKYGILQPYPLTQGILSYYVTQLGSQGLSPSTIKVYLSPLRQQQIARDLPEPGHTKMPKLKTIQAGIAKVHALRSPDCKDTRLPITAYTKLTVGKYVVIPAK